jgi:Fic family protein
MKLQVIPTEYFEYYKKKQPVTLSKHFNKLKETELTGKTFRYSASIASVYSSMIEGNTIDVDSYLKYSSSGMNTKSKSFHEIEDLITAYEFSYKEKLTLDSFLKMHSILSKTLISDKTLRGKIRSKDVYIYLARTTHKELIYTGTPKETVKSEMNIFFDDIAILIKKDLTITEVFYYASMIHLVFAHIHPFADGNGRSARLLEKWFLATKLGPKAWYIQSEKLYQKRIKSYYKNIEIGKDYAKTNYDLSIPFLLMLPMALTQNKS